MHPDVIEAVKVFRGEDDLLAELRVKDTLRAQAKPEAIPDGAVDAFDRELRKWNSPPSLEAKRAALSAALEHMAGGE
jgi:hypothetical protein